MTASCVEASKPASRNGARSCCANCPARSSRLAREPASRCRTIRSISDAPLDSLPFRAGGFDAVVCSLVLCSVPEQPAALAAIARVLKPGGHLVFLEHVAADGRPGRLKWQRRVEPVWKHLMGNCHLTRRTEAAIAAAGFEIERIQRESIRKALPIVRPSIRGIARKL